MYYYLKFVLSLLRCMTKAPNSEEYIRRLCCSDIINPYFRVMFNPIIIALQMFTPPNERSPSQCVDKIGRAHV